MTLAGKPRILAGMRSSSTIWSGVYMAVSCLVAVLLALLFVLAFRHCENADDRVIECVRTGRMPLECKAAMSMDRDR